MTHLFQLPPAGFWPILVAALVSTIAGFAWYSKAMFGDMWAKAIGWDTGDPVTLSKMKRRAIPAYIVGFIFTIVTAVVMAKLIETAQADSAITGVILGFMLWLGFVLPLKIGEVTYGGKGKELLLVDGSYQLVSLLLMGAILGIWK